MIIWFCWTLIHVSHFYWSSRFEAFGPVLHFRQKALLHVLHLTVAVLKCKATEHLAHFSLELLASIRDMPWNRGEFSDGGVGRAWEMCCWLNEDSPAVGEKWRWQCQRVCGFSDPLEIVKPLHVARRRQTLSKNVFFYFYFIRVFFHDTDESQGGRRREKTFFLFHSTTSTRSQTFRHLFGTLHVRWLWLSHVFNRSACIYQTATLWDLPPYQITFDWFVMQS